MTKHHCHFKDKPSWNSTLGCFTQNCKHPKNHDNGMVCTGPECPANEPPRSNCRIAETLLELNLTRIDGGTVKLCGWADSCRIMDSRENEYYPECTGKGIKEWATKFLKAFGENEDGI